MKRRKSGCQTPVRDIELVDLGEKLGHLEFFIKTDLDGTLLAGPLMIMKLFSG